MKIRTTVVVTLLSLLLPGGPAWVHAEGVANSGFEVPGPKDVPMDWQVGKHFGKTSPGATFTADATAPHHGSYCLKIASASVEIPAIIMSAPVDVEAGGTYRLSAHIRGEAKATAIRMMVMPNDYKNVATAALKVTDQWQPYDLTFKAPATGVRPVHVRFDLMEPGAIWIDDVTFTQTSAGNGAMSDAAADRPADHVLDGGLEQSPPGQLPRQWEIGKHYGQVPAGATFTIDNAVARSGNCSIKITSPSDEGIPAILMSNPVAIEPGETYVLSAYLKSDAKTAEAQLLALRADYKGADRAPLVITDQWRRYRLVFKAAANATAYFARFDAGHGTMWIDDVTLTKLAEAPADAAGPALGYRYADTPGDKAVTLTVAGPTGKTLPNINGVCYHRGFGLKDLPPKWADTNIKVVRLHNVLSHQQIVRKNPDGGFAYDYTLLDKSIDEILAIGAVPQMSLCFVPVEMVDNPDPNLIRDKYFRGQPSDYGQWEQYVFNVVEHCTKRYANVADWYWIVGNEPGVRQFSVGTQENFYTLYRHTLAGAVRANEKIQIGAGSFAHFAWLKDFVQRCAADKTRVDLISWHHYDIVPEDYAVKIQAVRNLVAQYPTLAHVKLAIDEWNTILPDARPAELSAGNYAAAHVVASIYTMMTSGLDYQTHFIASSPHGWGMTGNKGIKQPTFNAFEMLGMLGSEELAITVPPHEPYVGGFATRRDDGAIALLIWYTKSRNDISPDLDKSVTVSLAGVSSSATVTRYIIDRQFSNSQSDPKRENLESVLAVLRPRSDGSGAEIQFDASANSVSLLLIKPQ